MEIRHVYMNKYTLVEACDSCKTAIQSSSRVTSHMFTDTEHKEMRAAFREELTRLGWYEKPALCPDCRRRIVRETIDQITAVPDPAAKGDGAA